MEGVYFSQIHHAGRSQAGHGRSAAPCHGHQRRLLEVRGHQVQEERGFPGRHRVCQPPGMFLEGPRFLDVSRRARNKHRSPSQ